MSDHERDQEWLDQSMAELAPSPDDPPEVKVEKSGTAAIALFARHEYLTAAQMFTRLADYARVMAENKIVEAEIEAETIARRGKRTMRKCASCAYWFEIGGNGRRKDARYCSARCRVVAHRARKAKAEPV